MKELKALVKSRSRNREDEPELQAAVDGAAEAEKTARREALLEEQKDARAALSKKLHRVAGRARSAGARSERVGLRVLLREPARREIERRALTGSAGEPVGSADSPDAIWVMKLDWSRAMLRRQRFQRASRSHRRRQFSDRSRSATRRSALCCWSRTPWIAAPPLRIDRRAKLGRITHIRRILLGRQECLYA